MLVCHPSSFSGDLFKCFALASFLVGEVEALYTPGLFSGLLPTQAALETESKTGHPEKLEGGEEQVKRSV